jgi:hypothetical protein
MDIQASIALHGYGSSEGLRKAWDTRGRNAKKSADKSARAKASYVPVGSAKIAISAENVNLLAAAIGGTSTPDHHPWDVLIGNRVAIELKTIFPDAKHGKMTVHPESRERKEAFAKKNGIKLMYMVAVSMREKDKGIYIKRAADPKAERSGWSYNLRTMTRVNSFKDVKKEIG